MTAKEYAIKFAGYNCEYLDQDIEGIIFGYSNNYVWLKITFGADGSSNYSLKEMKQDYKIVCLIPVNEEDEVIGVPYEAIQLIEDKKVLDREIIQELINKLEL